MTRVPDQMINCGGGIHITVVTVFMSLTLVNKGFPNSKFTKLIHNHNRVTHNSLIDSNDTIDINKST